MKKWDDLPKFMRVTAVKPYHDILSQHRASLIIKRIFDIIVASILLIVLSPVFLIVSMMIKLDSKGPVMFRQVRVTTYGKEFRIFKFRTMVNHADQMGSQVTTKSDTRVTKVGKLLRKTRIDEFPQLLNVLVGDMTFVGTRPEVSKYVAHYTDEMKATLLLPAGITSQTSIYYKDEEKLLENASDADMVYINDVLPEKMKYNLSAIRTFSFLGDIKTMINTVIAVSK